MRKTSLLSILILGVALVWGSSAKATCPAFQSSGVIVAGFVPPVPSVATFNSFAFGFPVTNAQFFGFNSFGGGLRVAPAGGALIINNRFGPFGGLRRQQIIVGR